MKAFAFIIVVLASFTVSVVSFADVAEYTGRHAANCSSQNFETAEEAATLGVGEAAVEEVREATPAADEE